MKYKYIVECESDKTYDFFMSGNIDAEPKDPVKITITVEMTKKEYESSSEITAQKIAKLFK